MQQNTQETFDETTLEEENVRLPESALEEPLLDLNNFVQF
jgi:hypothetical protein